MFRRNLFLITKYIYIVKCFFKQLIALKEFMVYFNQLDMLVFRENEKSLSIFIPLIIFAMLFLSYELRITITTAST